MRRANEPGLARIGLRIADDRVVDPTRVREAQPLGAEQLGVLVLDIELVQTIGPEADRARRNRQVEDLQLVRAALAHPPSLAVREGGQQRARVTEATAVVEMVDRDFPVEQHRLLDALQAKQPHVEVVVLLRAADAERQVMGATNEPWIRHRSCSSPRCLSVEIIVPQHAPASQCSAGFSVQHRLLSAAPAPGGPGCRRARRRSVPPRRASEAWPNRCRGRLLRSPPTSQSRSRSRRSRARIRRCQ